MGVSGRELVDFVQRVGCAIEIDGRRGAVSCVAFFTKERGSQSEQI